MIWKCIYVGYTIHVNLMMEKQEEINLILNCAVNQIFMIFRVYNFESSTVRQCIDRIGYASSIHLNV